MNAVRRPRFWLLIWGGLGALVVLYVMIAASVQTSPRATPSALRNDPALLVGEMGDFAYANPPRPAPTEPFLHEGEEMTLADFKGRAVLVNFWATWCAPCLKELPSLDALQAKLGGPDFEVVAVAADPRGPEVAAEFLGRLEIRRLKLYADPRLRLASSIGGAAVLPVSILYDKRGREIGRIVGEADWTSPEAINLIQSVIGG